MKYCTHCGKELLDDAIVCPGCGCAVESENNASASSQFVSPQPVNDSYSTMSIIGLVFSLLGGILGLILSILAYNEAKRTGSQKSKSMSKAGIIISSIYLGFVVLLFLIIMISGIAAAGAAGAF